MLRCDGVVLVGVVHAVPASSTATMRGKETPNRRLGMMTIIQPPERNADFVRSLQPTGHLKSGNN